MYPKWTRTPSRLYVATMEATPRPPNRSTMLSVGRGLHLPTSCTLDRLDGHKYDHNTPALVFHHPLPNLVRVQDPFRPDQHVEALSPLCFDTSAVGLHNLQPPAVNVHTARRNGFRYKSKNFAPIARFDYPSSATAPDRLRSHSQTNRTCTQRRWRHRGESPDLRLYL